MKELSNQAQAAKLIRQELKAAFPGVKFSVTSRSYSMGNSVNVRWDNGPTTDAVDDIVGKYEYGHYNGMDDIYEYSNRRTDIPQTKYVMTQRTVTDDIYKQSWELLFHTYEDFKGLTIFNGGTLSNFCNIAHEFRTVARRCLSKIDLRTPLTHDILWEAR